MRMPRLDRLANGLFLDGRVTRAMRPMLDPERDLKGAVPETPTEALFRRTETLRLETRTQRKHVQASL